MIITRILAAECKVPLPKPIRLGPVTITTRDFVVVRLETDTGLRGDAVAYSRGSALFESVRRMAPFVLGTDPTMRRRTVEQFLQNFVNGRPTFIKAASLVDIALWDLAAKASEQPLWHLLGGYRDRSPVMVVAGYYLDQRTIEDVCEEVRLRVDEGYSRIKIMISGTDPDLDVRLVEKALAIAGDRLCVDAHWCFDSIEHAYRALRRLEPFALRFIEDPFGPHRGGWMPELQGMLATPLAYGEDLADPAAITDAISNATILRLDATTCGGVGPFMGYADMAAHAGRVVLPHVFTSIHAQLAGACRSVDAVEYIPDESGACPIFQLLEERPVIENGEIILSASPGAGQSLDWDAVERTAADRRFVLAQ